MKEIISNYYVSNFIYASFLILISAIVISNFNKKNIRIKEKMSLKGFDMLFFIQILLFSFSIRILLEQFGVNYNLIVNEDNFEIGILTMMIFFIVRCVIAPIT